jgi:hypothetical protein
MVMKGYFKELKPQRECQQYIESASTESEQTKVQNTIKMAFFHALICLRMAMKFQEN